MVTGHGRPRSDIYEKWARLPDDPLHFLNPPHIRDRNLGRRPAGWLRPWHELPGTPPPAFHASEPAGATGQTPGANGPFLMAVPFDLSASVRPAAAPDRNAPPEIELYLNRCFREPFNPPRRCRSCWRLLTTQPRREYRNTPLLSSADLLALAHRAAVRTPQAQGLGIEHKACEIGEALEKAPRNCPHRRHHHHAAGGAGALRLVAIRMPTRPSAWGPTPSRPSFGMRFCRRRLQSPAPPRKTTESSTPAPDSFGVRVGGWTSARLVAGQAYDATNHGPLTMRDGPPRALPMAIVDG